MAGLKISSGLRDRGEQGAQDGQGQDSQLAAAEAALISGRAIAAALAEVIASWQYALDRAAFLKDKAAHGSDTSRFYALEISAILADLDELAARLEVDIAEQGAFELPQFTDLALKAADFGVSAASLCADTTAPSPATPSPSQPARQLRVARIEDQPVPAQLSVLEAAQSHLAEQRAVLAAAEAKLDGITSQAQVLAENLSAARSHLSARRYGAELTKVTAEQMHARAATAAAAIGGLHRVDDGIFWGQ